MAFADGTEGQPRSPKFREIQGRPWQVTHALALPRAKSARRNHHGPKPDRSGSRLVAVHSRTRLRLECPGGQAPRGPAPGRSQQSNGTGLRCDRELRREKASGRRALGNRPSRASGTNNLPVARRFAWPMIPGMRLEQGRQAGTLFNSGQREPSPLQAHSPLGLGSESGFLHPFVHYTFQTDSKQLDDVA